MFENRYFVHFGKLHKVSESQNPAVFTVAGYFLIRSMIVFSDRVEIQDRVSESYFQIVFQDRVPDRVSEFSRSYFQVFSNRVLDPAERFSDRVLYLQQWEIPNKSADFRYQRGCAYQNRSGGAGLPYGRPEGPKTSRRAP